MHHDFEDITSRISEQPSWWDSNGTPRYGDFVPKACPNIYAEEVALLLIRCQNCHKEFKVEMHMDMLQRVDRFAALKASGKVQDEDAKEVVKHFTLAVWIKEGVIHYGDPPRHDYTECAAGQSMNCEDIKVLEYWRKDQWDWVRDSSLEIDIVMPE